MQQQQHANFDLLAVFNEESKAEAAEARLRKEGFGDDEVFRLQPGLVGRSEFREHGPNRERSAVFLQTRRSGPGPLVVTLFALIFALLFGALAFGVVDVSLKSLPLLPATALGVLAGIIVGALLGLTRKGRMRGAIGQNPLPEPPAQTPQVSALRTVVAVRLPDPENISRKSKARAILLNNGGKIDRSVGAP
ncbi:MAG TPA: hypothetical protein VGF67_17905 [Ktedonobacteraceae bacterium]|jgi:hypothetical protein